MRIRWCELPVKKRAFIYLFLSGWIYDCVFNSLGTTVRVGSSNLGDERTTATPNPNESGCARHMVLHVISSVASQSMYDK